MQINEEMNKVIKIDGFVKFIVINQDNKILLYNHNNSYKLFTSCSHDERDIVISINSIGSWIKKPILNVSRIFTIKFSCTRIQNIQGSIYLIRILSDQKKNGSSKHLWINQESDLPKNLSIIDKEITLLVRKHIECKKPDNHYEKSPLIRHKFHKKVISKIFYTLSSKKIKHRIIEQLAKWKLRPNGKHKIIDVSCGYDELLIDLSSHFKNSTIIGNDLVWQSLLPIARNQSNNNIIHTNYNILSPEFCKNQEFDLIICKNTLHHISFQEQKCLIRKLISAGKRILIIEIENPLKNNILSYLWNFYYKHFLKDNGTNFLNRKYFMNLISKSFNTPIRCRFSLIDTMKGTYMMAAIENIGGGVNW